LTQSNKIKVAICISQIVAFSIFTANQLLNLGNGLHVWVINIFLSIKISFQSVENGVFIVCVSINKLVGVKKSCFF